MDYRDYFKDKKITVMGLGLLGRGVGDVAFLAELGADLVVTDLKTEDELEESIVKLSGYANITYRLGGHDLDDFKNKDLILRSANIPLDSEYLKEAERHGIPVTQSTALFAKFTEAKLIGVTGTRGKSTVTQMVYEIFKKTGERTFLGGNVRGVSTLALLPELQKEDYCVLELDSWQLQSFGTEKISPHVAVFTTFMQDHMNYYKGDMLQYLDDKANIFKYQTPGDVLVIGNQADRIIEEKYNNDILAHKYVASGFDIPHDWQLKMPGDHNRYNAGIAKVICEQMGVNDEIIKKVITEFKGMPFRLEFVGEVDGVSIYNDSNGTSPDATIAAINSFGDKNIVLIAGGTDKKLDVEKLTEEIQGKVKGLVLLSGSGTDRLKEFLLPGSYTEFDELGECLTQARELADDADVVVFSPGFSSFEKFKNEYDRGEQFTELVKKSK